MARFLLDFVSAWVVPGPTLATARVRVVWAPAQTILRTSGTFTMAAPTITLMSPNTAVNWAMGTTRTITWNQNLGTQESVEIQESIDGGANWTTIAPGVANTANTTGTYNWLVGTPASTTARIRVRWAANTAVAGQSAVNFTVAAPFVTVTAPNTAVAWPINSTQSITFNHNLGTGQAVSLELSRDGGTNYSSITSLTTTSATTGSFSWTVTAPSTNQERVRATWTGIQP